ncbi:unnamed protein product, partial [Mesorhabditis belari]|uniref:Uncharacterized protein n=1 Tax=Mesorhabditis belari TaxID=2138241 RepID=A0AAF3EGW3_9BILA
MLSTSFMILTRNILNWTTVTIGINFFGPYLNLAIWQFWPFAQAFLLNFLTSILAILLFRKTKERQQNRQQIVTSVKICPSSSPRR